jgi:hypothetical protein
MDGDDWDVVRGCVTICGSGSDFGSLKVSVLRSHDPRPLIVSPRIPHFVGSRLEARAILHRHSASKKCSQPSSVPCSSRRVYRSKDNRRSGPWS